MKPKKYLQIINFIFIIFNSVNTGFSQITVKVWDVRFGSTGEDVPNAIEQTEDGGYIVGCWSTSDSGGEKSQPSHGGTDFWILKMDINGIKQWDKSFGGSGDDHLHSLEIANNGDYVIGGSSDSDEDGDVSENSRGKNDYWVVRITANGEKIWDRRFGGSAGEILRAIKKTKDGGFIIGGYSLSGISGDKTGINRGPNGTGDYWIVKIDSNGTKQWDKTFGGNQAEELVALTITPDDGFLLAGFSASGISGEKTQASYGDKDFWIVKTDSNGIKQWDASFGGSDRDFPLSVVATYDGGYLIDGYSWSGISGNKTSINKGESDFWMVKIDANGLKQWDKDFGGSDVEESRSVVQTADSGYFLGGYTVSGISGDVSDESRGLFDYWVVKTNAAGDKQWDLRLGGSMDDHTHLVMQAADGSLIIAGHSISGINGDKSESNRGLNDVWIIRLVNEHQLISIIPSDTFYACKNDPVTFRANGPNVESYQWYRNGTAVNGATNDEFTTTYGTKIYVAIELTNGSGTSSDTTTIVRSPKPSAKISVVGSNLDLCAGTVKLRANRAVHLTYQWNIGDVVIEGATDRIYIPTIVGSYNVLVSNTLTGCTKLSAPVAVVNSCKTFYEASLSDEFLLYPNPCSETLTVNIFFKNKLAGEVRMKITNALGQIIREVSTSSTNGIVEQQMELEEMPQGIYEVTIICDGITGSRKFIKL